MLVGAEVAGLAAAVAEGLAVTGADGAAGDCTEPGLDDPQPASVTSATSAAAVTEKRLLISLETPKSSTRLPQQVTRGCRRRSVKGSRPGRRCHLRARAGRTHRGGPRVASYQPGEFYLRELPPLRAVLDNLSGLGLLVAGGYADLDPAGRPGLGAHAHAEFGIPVTGVAKSRFGTATHAVPVLRGRPRSKPGLSGRCLDRSRGSGLLRFTRDPRGRLGSGGRNLHA